MLSKMSGTSGAQFHSFTPSEHENSFSFLSPKDEGDSCRTSKSRSLLPTCTMSSGSSGANIFDSNSGSDFISSSDAQTETETPPETPANGLAPESQWDLESTGLTTPRAQPQKFEILETRLARPTILTTVCHGSPNLDDTSDDGGYDSEVDLKSKKNSENAALLQRRTRFEREGRSWAHSNMWKKRIGEGRIDGRAQYRERSKERETLSLKSPLTNTSGTSISNSTNSTTQLAKPLHNIEINIPTSSPSATQVSTGVEIPDPATRSLKRARRPPALDLSSISTLHTKGNPCIDESELVEEYQAGLGTPLEDEVMLDHIRPQTAPFLPSWRSACLPAVDMPTPPATAPLQVVPKAPRLFPSMPVMDPSPLFLPSPCLKTAKPRLVSQPTSTMSLSVFSPKPMSANGKLEITSRSTSFGRQIANLRRNSAKSQIPPSLLGSPMLQRLDTPFGPFCSAPSGSRSIPFDGDVSPSNGGPHSHTKWSSGCRAVGTPQKIHRSSFYDKSPLELQAEEKDLTPWTECVGSAESDSQTVGDNPYFANTKLWNSKSSLR